MLDAALLARKFALATQYAEYVRTGKPAHQEAWAKVHQSVALTPPQRALLGAFTRRMHILVSSGTWCGDCSAQCPMLARIEEANPERIAVRFVDRDAHADLAERVMINAGLRVPTVIFCAEDFEFVGLVGDRTLTRYRAVAARKLGAACPLPGAPIPAEELAATVQDWVDEFERVHLLLRLSARLREKHGD